MNAFGLNGTGINKKDFTKLSKMSEKGEGGDKGSPNQNESLVPDLSNAL